MALSVLQNYIQNRAFWLVDRPQIHGGNFELIGRLTSRIPCKDSNIVRYRNGQEKFEPEQWWSVVTSHDLAWPILIWFQICDKTTNPEGCFKNI